MQHYVKSVHQQHRFGMELLAFLNAIKHTKDYQLFRKIMYVNNTRPGT